ncbi:hypothetical protein F5144DRAFT_605124 [Chaetomium tenue]|uniref:Uncharacterized protein n=1 Tax=Chaetomium tenue TaxID=1854479 RepID=A0ACB7NWU4_9PEZI|nr:hypothetical protein F5144DRAFT_605124 [Chaetomium globosum]
MPSNDYPAAANRSWRVNAMAGTRSVDFQSRFNVLEDVSGAPTSVKFSAPCPFATTVQCYAGTKGTGMMTAVNVPANGVGAFNVSFKSWRVIRR